MKIWIKFLTGTVLGVFLGLLLPVQNSELTSFFTFLYSLVIQIGRYCLFPLLFFSIAIGVYELREDKQLSKVLVKGIAFLLITSAALVVFGIVSVFVFSPDRIPILSEGSPEKITLDLKQAVLSLFPNNLFAIFSQDGNYLLPVCFLSMILGLAFTVDKTLTKPVLAIFDSLSRIFYHILSFFIEFIGIGIVFLAAGATLQIRAISDIQIFAGLMSLLAVDTLFVAFVIFPLMVYLLGGRKSNPYKYLYGILAPALAAIFSGDVHFSLAMLLKHEKENLGVRRRIGTVSLPFFTLFGRAGTAMVTAVSFVVIIKSYSSLGINLGQVFWIAGASFIISLLLGSVPGMGSMVSISVLCTIYGQGFEAGYLIVKPIAFFLVACGTFIDCITASLCTLVIAKQENAQTDHELRHFV
jgi:aerobic C4-dicarboxylate transport protein